MAFSELNAVAYELPGIYSLIGELVLTMYWLYIEMHGCLGPTNVEAMQKAVDKKMAQYPKVGCDHVFRTVTHPSLPFVDRVSCTKWQTPS